jgi:hypothetical protein
MSRATDLAEWICRVAGAHGKLNVETCADISAELRRIPELERQLADAQKRAERALTETELVRLANVADLLRRGEPLPANALGADWVRDIVNRLRPQPIDWHDVGDGAIAALGDWTLTVTPSWNELGMWQWKCAHKAVAGDWSRADTLDAAKSAAETWVRKQPS